MLPYLYDLRYSLNVKISIILFIACTIVNKRSGTLEQPSISTGGHDKRSNKDMTSLERKPSQLASNCCLSIESAELADRISDDYAQETKA